MAKKRLTKEAREELIVDYRASAKAQKQWCEENGVEKAPIRGWVKKLIAKAK